MLPGHSYIVLSLILRFSSLLLVWLPRRWENVKRIKLVLIIGVARQLLYNIAPISRTLPHATGER
ncbi:hypothetical protein K449DRAFT_386663 [Hypoxylon sp. EC38]|nr:hypothetical protein K449DRAFT_386663 [Hypoxylon sp. EC38]